MLAKQNKGQSERMRIQRYFIEAFLPLIRGMGVDVNSLFCFRQQSLMEKRVLDQVGQIQEIQIHRGSGEKCQVRPGLKIKQVGKQAGVGCQYEWSDTEQISTMESSKWSWKFDQLNLGANPPTRKF